MNITGRVLRWGYRIMAVTLAMTAPWQADPMRTLFIAAGFWQVGDWQASILGRGVSTNNR